MHVLCKHLFCVISIVRCAHKLKAGAEKRSDKRPGESRPDIDDTKCLIALGTILAVFSPTPPPPHTPQPRSNQQTQLTNFHTHTTHIHFTQTPTQTGLAGKHRHMQPSLHITITHVYRRTSTDGAAGRSHSPLSSPTRPPFFPLRRVAKQGSRSSSHSKITKILRWNRPFILLDVQRGGCHPPHSPTPSRH